MARDYLKGRGLGEDACRAFRLGLALGGDTLARKALAKGFTREELRAAGLTRQRGDDYFSRRLALPARRCARPRGRLPGAPAARRRPAEGEVREHARVRALPQGLGRLRARQGAGRDRARGSRVHRRGQHRRDRPAPGGLRAGRREHGDGADRAAAEGAGAAEQRLWLASTATRPARRRRCAGWSSRRGRASTSRSSRCRRGSTRPTSRTASSSGSPPPSRTRSTASGSRSSAPTTARRRSGSCADARRAPDSPERQEAWRLANDRLGMTVQLRAGGSSARAAAAPSQRGCRRERQAGAGCARRVLAHPRCKPLLAELGPEHFTTPLHRACAPTSSTGAS